MKWVCAWKCGRTNTIAPLNDKRTTHGICKPCVKKMERAAQKRRAR